MLFGPDVNGEPKGRCGGDIDPDISPDADCNLSLKPEPLKRGDWGRLGIEAAVSEVATILFYQPFSYNDGRHTSGICNEAVLIRYCQTCQRCYCRRHWSHFSH